MHRVDTSINKICETLSLFEGIHNFASFAINKTSRIKSKSHDESGVKNEIPYEPDFFIRKVDKISVEPVNPPLSSNFSPIYDLFEFYTAEFISKGFFQNQVCN